MGADFVGITVKALPKEGEANMTLCKFLSEVLEEDRLNVALKSGSKSKMKIFEVVTKQSVMEVESKLSAKVVV
jgi:uncharacterized protein YggU (UPF0235/DUF167 family)